VSPGVMHRISDVPTSALTTVLLSTLLCTLIPQPHCLAQGQSPGSRKEAGKTPVPQEDAWALSMLRHEQLANALVVTVWQSLEHRQSNHQCA
jgi:hypothetical protein